MKSQSDCVYCVPKKTLLQASEVENELILDCDTAITPVIPSHKYHHNAVRSRRYVKKHPRVQTRLIKRSRHESHSQQEAEEREEGGRRGGEGFQGEASSRYDTVDTRRLGELGLTGVAVDKKARDDMAKKAGGKGPMNTGQQGQFQSLFGPLQETLTMA